MSQYLCRHVPPCGTPGSRPACSGRHRSSSPPAPSSKKRCASGILRPPGPQAHCAQPSPWLGRRWQGRRLRSASPPCFWLPEHNPESPGATLSCLPQCTATIDQAGVDFTNSAVQTHVHIGSGGESGAYGPRPRADERMAVERACDNAWLQSRDRAEDAGGHPPPDPACTGRHRMRGAAGTQPDSVRLACSKQ